MLKRLIDYIRGDIKVKGTQYFDYGKKVIDGFYFVYKKPFTTRYSRNAPISIEYIDYILNKLNEALKNGKSEVHITVNKGTIDEETIFVPERSVLKVCFEMTRLKVKVLEGQLEHKGTKELINERAVKDNVVYFEEYAK